jgi:hypothetical protein
MNPLDTATELVKAEANELRATPEIEPSDLSSKVAELRALLWSADSLAKVIATKYGSLGELRHDGGEDPYIAAEMVTMRLGDVSIYLANADEALADAHNQAARLASL